VALAVTSPRRAVSAVAANVVLAFVAVAFLAPLAWLVLSALNPAAQLALTVPQHPGLSNFSAVMTPDTTYRPMWNGLLLCGGAALVSVFTATLCAYPLSRYNIRFKRPFLYTILFATGLPITAVMVPVYSLFVRLNLIDSLTGTMLFMAATTLPFAIFLTKNFIDGVPLTLEEAAWVDGAGQMQSLRHVVVPLILPGMAVVGIFTFIEAWGNFFVPFILLLSPEKQPASVSIFTFFGEHGSVLYGQLAAYSILYSTPVIVLYLIVNKSLGGAFNLAGAVKG
jgi:multiple sugar transport system permease protein